MTRAFLLILGFLFVFVFATTIAMAAPKSEKLTPDEFTLVQKVYDECAGSRDVLSYKCDCVAVRNLELKKSFFDDLDRHGANADKQAYEWNRNGYLVLRKAYSQCVNVDRLAVETYTNCVETNLKARADFREFCGCYAVNYSDIYAVYGTEPLFATSDLMTKAIEKCAPKTEMR